MMLIYTFKNGMLYNCVCRVSMTQNL